MTDKPAILDLPSRKLKPRSTGLTSMYDIGMPLGMTKDYLETFSDLIDIAKLAVGTGYVMPRVDQKISLYRSYGIHVQFGGTLFEKFYTQGKSEDYIDFITDLGADTLEISDGSTDIPVEEIFAMVEKGRERGLKVLVEYGSKDPDAVASPAKWVSVIQSYLDCGADYVITESRDSGTAGIFSPSGELRSSLVEDIGNSIDTERLLFEAPTPRSQMHFINVFGSNVNLANIKPNDILVLEAQRMGIRYETFNLKH